MTVVEPESRAVKRAPEELGWWVVGVSAALGVWADILFNGAALGLNVPLWIGGLVGAFVLIAWRRGRTLGRLPVALLATSLALSMMVAWRSAAALQVVLLGATVASLLLALVAHDDAHSRRPSITLLFSSLLTGAVAVARGVVFLPQSLSWRALLDRRAGEHAQAVGRAALLAAPLLLVFGALFFAADAIFASRIKASLSIDLDGVVVHLRWWVAGATAAAGVLWCGVTSEEAAHSGPELAAERRLHVIEISVVLGSLAVLFGLFVMIQVQYLFGGTGHVQASEGLTYAEYARRGFFELVAVAALLLPVLLAVDWARGRSRRSLTAYRVLAGLLVLLLGVVMASAFQRLRIYVDVFGLTALRFYAAALLAWFVGVFAWLGWSLLRERRNEFVAGAAFTAVLALVAVVAVNPHGFIAATNLSRAEQGRDFDVQHALGLSADATPTLIDRLEVLSADEGCELAAELTARWGDFEEELRSWNWGRVAAAGAVDANRDRLESACD